MRRILTLTTFCCVTLLARAASASPEPAESVRLLGFVRH